MVHSSSRSVVQDGTGRFADPNGTFEEKYLHYLYAHRQSEATLRGWILADEVQQKAHAIQLEKTKKETRRRTLEEVLATVNVLLTDALEVKPALEPRVVSGVEPNETF